MKRNLLPGLALTLTFVAAIAFTGCDSGLFPEAGAAAPNTDTRAVADSADSGNPAMVTVSGPLAIIDGAFAILYQGNAYHVKGLSRLAADTDLAEGTDLTIEGEAAPILDRDAGGDSLFYGYYLKAEKVSLN